MFNHDNVYYFPENIDVRSCPKNASASLKQFHKQVINTVYPDNTLQVEKVASLLEKEATNGGGMSYRWKQILEQADHFDLPFRKESIRMVIKRDPVDRFKSAVEMLQSEEYFSDNYHVIHKTGLYPESKHYRLYQSVTELLNDLEEGKITDMHLWTQTFYLGDKKQYDYIYDIEEYRKFQRHVLSLLNIAWNEKKWYAHVNISNNTPPEEIEDIKVDRNHKLIRTIKYYDPSKFLITSAMTAKDYYRVKKLYQEDYDNGWC